MNMQAIWCYINSIRNKEKRNYARAYLFWLQNGSLGNGPAAGCSVMAAQAVRLELDSIALTPATN